MNIEFNYKDRIIKHIEALTKAYDNIIDVLNQDLKKKDSKDDKSEEEFALKDAQIKTYADGILKASEAADKLLDQIRLKYIQLENLQKIEKAEKEGANKEEVDLDDEGIFDPEKTYKLSKYLD